MVPKTFSGIELLHMKKSHKESNEIYRTISPNRSISANSILSFGESFRKRILYLSILFGYVEGLVIVLFSGATLRSLLLALITLVSAHAETIRYGYDALNRLTHVIYSDGGSISYGYDKGGNRILLKVVPPNHAPVAVADSLGTIENRAQSAPVAKFLLNDSDPDGDTLVITSVISTSLSGGIVVLDGANITYTPPAGFSGKDQFTYTVSDGREGAAVGTVLVVVRDASAPPLNQAILTITRNGKLVQFSGIPDQQYAIEFADFVEGPWEVLSTVFAGPTGFISFQDIENPPPVARFYRIISVP